MSTVPSQIYIRKDGTVIFTANQSMGGNRLTNMANAVNPYDAVNLSQAQSLINTASNQQRIAGLYTAGENITKFQVVYVKNDGKVYLGNSSDVTQMERIIGIALDSVSAGATLNVATIGEVTGFTGLLAGSYYFVNTSGNLTLTIPVVGFRQIIGLAISSTTLLISLKPAIAI